MRGRFGLFLMLCVGTVCVFAGSSVRAQGLITDVRDQIEEKIQKSKVLQTLKDGIEGRTSSTENRQDEDINVDPDASVAVLNDTAAGVAFNAYPSLFLKPWQRKNIFDVRNSQGQIYEDYLRELDEMRRAEQKKETLEVKQEEVTRRASIPKPPEEERYIDLQGVLYLGPSSWIVYLNGMKITPDSKPDNIVDIKVHADSVELQWYDEYSNKVIPVRLRPLQRFHMDSRTFMSSGS